MVKGVIKEKLSKNTWKRYRNFEQTSVGNLPKNDFMKLMEKTEQLKGLEIKFTCPFCNWESEKKPLTGDKISSTNFTKEGISTSYKINKDQSHNAFVEVFKKHLSDSNNCFSLFMEKYVKMEELISKMALKEQK